MHIEEAKIRIKRLADGEGTSDDQRACAVILQHLESRMKYKVLFSNNLSDLIRDVNTHLEQGWEPAGGLVITHQEHAVSPLEIWRYYQAITCSWKVQ